MGLPSTDCQRMSFSLDLHAGAVKTIYLGNAEKPRPILQILKLKKMDLLQNQFVSDRFKMLLSDGLNFIHAVLSPKLNPLVYRKQLDSQSIIKLVEYDVHFIKGKKLVVILHLEEIVSQFPITLGSPVAVESSVLSHGDEGKKCKALAPVKSVNGLSQDFLYLLNNPELSDVNFLLRDGQRIFAHKNILVIRSPYFRSLFLNGMKESFLTEIEIHDWNPQVFMDVLKFIYSELVALTSSMTLEIVWELFMAAKYYGLDRLARLCEQHVVNERINNETVTLLWNTAREVDAKHVDQACNRYYEQNFEQIAKTESFGVLPKELFLHILRSEDLVVSNQDVIPQAVIHWGQAQQELFGPEAVSKQDIFVQFFPLLRLRRKWNPSDNITDLKNSVLDSLRPTGLTGLRIAKIIEKLGSKFSTEDIR